MIDVIIPVYNTPLEDLKRCLDSIDSQTFKDYIVYIIDDGSDEVTHKWLDNYVTDKDNFKVRHVVNGGVSKARNLGIEISNSKYFTFLDADDMVSDKFLEEAFTLIEENDLDLIVGGYREICDGKVLRVRSSLENLKIYENDTLKLFLDKLISSKVQEDNKEIGSAPLGRIYTRLYRRSVLGNLRFREDVFMSEDTLYMIELMNLVKRVGLTSLVWYDYYLNSYSISNKKLDEKVIKRNLKFIEEIYLLMKNEIDPRIKNSYKIRILKGIRPLYENVSVAEKKNILELEYVREGLLGVDLSGYKDILKEEEFLRELNLNEDINNWQCWEWKSTFARKLGKILDTPVYEIDSIVHDDEKNVKRTSSEQQAIIKRIDKKKDWIIEGTLRKNLDNLLSKADKIIFLDIPVRVRRFRIFKRFIRQKLGIEKCNYKPSFKMLTNMYKWTRDFEREKVYFLERLGECQERLIIVKDINSFVLDDIEQIKMFKKIEVFIFFYVYAIMFLLIKIWVS